MNQKPVYTFARWQVKEGQLNTVLSLLATVVEKSSMEEGNLFYKVHQSNADPNTLILFEGYSDESAVEAHRNADYFQTIVAGKIVPLLESREVILASELDLAGR